jgi:DNA helicase-2/ATP-dependent DNA helicase PcrA
MVNVGANDMMSRLATLRVGRERRAASNAEAAVLRFENERTYSAAGAALAAINEEGGVRSHRPAILRGAYNLLKICDQTGVSPVEAAITVREQSRLIGRPLAKRTVGSTLLLKGLEAETCVILETESLPPSPLRRDDARGPTTDYLQPRQYSITGSMTELRPFVQTGINWSQLAFIRAI